MRVITLENHFWINKSMSIFEKINSVAIHTVHSCDRYVQRAQYMYRVLVCWAHHIFIMNNSSENSQSAAIKCPKDLPFF